MADILRSYVGRKKDRYAPLSHNSSGKESTMVRSASSESVSSISSSVFDLPSDSSQQGISKQKDLSRGYTEGTGLESSSNSSNRQEDTKLTGQHKNEMISSMQKSKEQQISHENSAELAHKFMQLTAEQHHGEFLTKSQSKKIAKVAQDMKLSDDARAHMVSKKPVQELISKVTCMILSFQLDVTDKLKESYYADPYHFKMAFLLMIIKNIRVTSFEEDLIISEGMKQFKLNKNTVTVFFKVYYPYSGTLLRMVTPDLFLSTSTFMAEVKGQIIMPAMRELREMYERISMLLGSEKKRNRSQGKIEAKMFHDVYKCSHKEMAKLLKDFYTISQIFFEGTATITCSTHNSTLMNAESDGYTVAHVSGHPQIRFIARSLTLI